MPRVLVRWALRIAGAPVLVVVALLLGRAIEDRGMPDLEPWHRTAPAGEFRASDLERGFGFDDYRALEDRLFEALDAYYLGPEQAKVQSGYLRYVAGGPSDPRTFTPDWNRSIEMVADAPRGGVLLLHGLSDSPYSMRSLAETFHREGFSVLAMRMPGHGTVPAGLLDVSWHDWVAAVEIGARHVRSRIAAGPFWIAGYSNGGALAVFHTLRALEEDGLPAPDRIVLLSPAIGLTPFARAATWYRLFSWIPAFAKSNWLSIQPEIDPFKYNSFAQNAGAQIWTLTEAIQERLARLADQGRLGRMPPILTFQSAVDATIVGWDVVTKLYDRLPANGSEVVVFDVNRTLDLEGLYVQDPGRLLAHFEEPGTRPYRFTLVTNRDRTSSAVVARTTVPVRSVPLDLAWPPEVYSLAHVAIPFPPDDPVYGSATPAAGDHHLRIGALALRGEEHVLAIPAEQLMRLRHNPFHAYMVGRVVEALRGGGAP